jgi:hypothetical protein
LRRRIGIWTGWSPESGHRPLAIVSGPMPSSAEPSAEQSSAPGPANRFLKTCDIVEDVSEGIARRAAYLRARAGTGSAVDAIVIALAEPGGAVLTSDPRDLKAIAGYAAGVSVITT